MAELSACQADMTFRCDGETSVPVMFERINPDPALAECLLTCEGNTV